MLKTSTHHIKEKTAAKKMETIVHSPFVKSVIAGSFSGTCSVVLFQPLDLLKTRLQSPVAVGKAPAGLLSTLTSVVKNEKLRGLWKGMTPSITRCVPGVGLYFGTLNWMQTNFGSSRPSSIENLAFGCASRSFVGFVMLPITVVKTRFESGIFNYRSIYGALVSIWKVEGVKGLYSGLSATLLRDAPYSGLYLMFYQKAKVIMPGHDQVSDSYLPVFNFSCAILAGCLAATCTQPADVIKTHMQLYPNTYTLKTVIPHIYKTDGLVGFVRGFVPRTMRRSLMTAMAWTVYEQLMKHVGLK